MEILRAGMEAVAFRFALIESGAAGDEVRERGGAQRIANHGGQLVGAEARVSRMLPISASPLA